MTTTHVGNELHKAIKTLRMKPESLLTSHPHHLAHHYFPWLTSKQRESTNWQLSHRSKVSASPPPPTLLPEILDPNDPLQFDTAARNGTLLHSMTEKLGARRKRKLFGSSELQNLTSESLKYCVKALAPYIFFAALLLFCPSAIQPYKQLKPSYPNYQFSSHNAQYF